MIIIISAIVVVSIAVLLFSLTDRYQANRAQALETFHSELENKQMPLHIVGIGDSLTKGVGDKDSQGYVGDTAKRLRDLSAISEVDLDDFGVRGDTTKDLLDVLKTDEVKKQLQTADYIFMTIGANDLVNVLKENFLNLQRDDFNSKRVTFEENLHDIIQNIRVQNPKATIYYLGIYNPFEDYLAQLDEQFSEIVDNWNQSSQSILSIYKHTVFIPTADIFHGKTDHLLFDDHFHPNPEGYDLLSKRLFSYIKKQ